MIDYLNGISNYGIDLSLITMQEQRESIIPRSERERTLFLLKNGPINKCTLMFTGNLEDLKRYIELLYSLGVEKKAKQILDDAGIVDTDGDGIRELDGQNINLRYISYENRLLNDFADAQAQYLAEIGIGVVPEYGSSDDQWSKLAALDYDFNNNNWITVGTGDPLAYMANWATDTSYCAYSNPDYDKLYEELKGEMDPEKRKDLIFQMQQILVDDAAVLIDGYYNSSMIYSKKVGSAHIHTADYYWLSTEITPAE